MKRQFFKISSALLLLVSYLGSQNSAQTKSSIAQDSRRMDQVVRFFSDEQKIFMGSVLVARGSEVLFAKGYGMANLEWNIANTPSTKFRLASVSKQFTAAAILLLEERGKLKVEDPIKRYIPDAPATWDGITIHHLLSHTSGLPDINDPESRGSDTVTARPGTVVLRLRDKPLEFTPGARFRYSNPGYRLLAHLIEKISGQTFEDFMRESIFQPLGMKDSGSDSYAEVIPRRASSYHYPRDPNNRLRELLDRPLENAPYINVVNAIGAGSLYSTVEDLHRWTQGLFGGKLLSAAALAKMTTTAQGTYAYGLVVVTVDGRRRIVHAGGIQGFHTVLIYYPDSKVTVAVLGNFATLANDTAGLRNAPETLAPWLGTLAHGEAITLPSERKAISVEAATLPGYAGVYEYTAPAAATTRLAYTVTLEADRLYLSGPRLSKSQMYAEAKDRFFLRERDVRIEFTRDETGKVTALGLGRIRAARK